MLSQAGVPHTPGDCLQNRKNFQACAGLSQWMIQRDLQHLPVHITTQ